MSKEFFRRMKYAGRIYMLHALNNYPLHARPIDPQYPGKYRKAASIIGFNIQKQFRSHGSTKGHPGKNFITLLDVVNGVIITKYMGTVYNFTIAVFGHYEPRNKPCTFIPGIPWNYFPRPKDATKEWCHQRMNGSQLFPSRTIGGKKYNALRSYQYGPK